MGWLIALLLVGAFVAGFFVGGKWKVRVMHEAMRTIGTAEEKLNAIRKVL